MRKGEDLDLQDETLWRAPETQSVICTLAKSIAMQRRLPSDTSGVFEIWE